MTEKPLKLKGYGSIPHLPNSRLGEGDHSISQGQADIVTKKTPDKHWKIIVTEKIDGSNTSICKVDNKIYALGRAGYTAQSSPYVQHQYFAHWVREREEYFNKILNNGERIVGEWCSQVHSTRYNLDSEPWFPFDYFTKDNKRINFDNFCEIVDDKLSELNLKRPYVISMDCISTEEVMKLLGKCGFHNALIQDGPEGAVWRAEYKNEFNFICKYVRWNKPSGKYLPEINPEIKEPIWNWRPRNENREGLRE